MKSKKSRYISLLVIAILFLGIVCFNYKQNKKIYNQPPSNKWSKEVIIGNGTINNAPKVIKEEDRIIIGYDNLNKFKISVTDNLGKKILEKVYEFNEEFILNTALTKTSNGYLFLYNSTKSGQPYMGKIYLDKNFEKIEEKVEDGVTNIVQLDDNLVIISNEDKLTIRNTEKENDINAEKMNAKNASNIVSCKLKDKYMIAFIENKCNFKSIFVENGKFKDGKDVFKTSNILTVNYENLACSSDGEYGYVMMEENVKGQYTGTKMIKFKLNGNEEPKVSTLKVNEYKEVHNNIGAYSEEGARFIGTIPIEKKDGYRQETIVDYIIKNGEVKSFENVSRLREMCIFPYINDDTIVYASFDKNYNYNINLARDNDEFKEKNNQPMKFESKLAFNHTIEQLAYSLSYILIIATKWVIPALFLGAVISFFDYKFRLKGKIILFMGSGVIAAVLKTIEIYKLIYIKGIILPNLIAIPSLGILVCIAISLISYLIGINRYRYDEDSSFIVNFGIGLMIDTILTLVMFTPYIYA